MSALVHLIYPSVQTRPLSTTELEELIQKSRGRNVEHDISGILLHVGDTFFQVLEGPTAAVEALYGKILKDPRHKRIIRIISESIARRYFGDSTMTLASLSPEELNAMMQDGAPAEREYLLDGLDEGRAKKLLRAFTDGRWRRHVVASPAPSMERL